MKIDSIKQLMLMQFEDLVFKLKYDFLYEDVDGELLCQIVKRDEAGSILGTPLSFHLNIDEAKGTGDVIYYNSQGEFKRQQFNVYEEGSLVNVLLFVQERLSINSNSH